MQYLKSSMLNGFINSIVTSAAHHIKKNENKTSNKAQIKILEPESIDNDILTPSNQEVCQFITELLNRSNEIIKQQQQIKKRGSLRYSIKKAVFDNLNMQPIYLHEHQNDYKLIQFQFQLGTGEFLQRIPILFEQLNTVQNSIQYIIQNSKQVNLLQAANILQKYNTRLKLVCSSLSQSRAKVNIGRLYKNNIIQKIIKKKTIQKKLHYAKQLKKYIISINTKCSNLEQVFYKERQTHSSYKKILKSQDLLNKVYCLKSVKFNLIKIAQKNVTIIQTYLLQWLKQSLTQKQIEKLLILIYYTRTQSIYIQNAIKLNFKRYDTKILKKKIQQVKNWKQFTYITDHKTKQRVNQFLIILANQIVN